MSWFNDLCTDTAATPATSHTTDSGHTWVLGVGATPAPVLYTSFGGVIASGSGSLQILRSSVIAPNADAVISAALYYDSGNFLTVGVAARLNSGCTAGYIAVYNIANTRWDIHRLGASQSTTLIASSATIAYASAATASIDFSVTDTGATVTLDLKVGGTSVVSGTDTSGSRTTAAGYLGLWFNTGVPSTGLFVNSISGADVAVAATAITMTGPTSGATGAASTNFTVGANGNITGTIVVTPSDSSGGGTFSPTTVSISPGSPTGTFTYTPASNGAKTVSVTNNGSLTNPSNITYTASSTAATAIVLTGPTSGPVSTASTNFTVAANGTLAATNTVTPSDSSGGGTFTPTSIALSSGTLSGTFVYTPGSTGAKSISITNSGSLTNSGSPITYTSSAATASAPWPDKVGDRVKDTASAASGSSITLNGASIALYRTFGTAFAVGTHGIPVFVGDQGGTAWMVCTCTLTSSLLLTVTSISSSSNAGAAPSFGGGTKDVMCVPPARMAYKAPCIHLADYDVDPTFTVDSTAGIQQAILDAYSRKIEKIQGIPGHFKIAGPLVGSGNCQIYMPQTRQAAHDKSIYIEGPNPPNFEQQGLVDMTPPNNGMVFESTIAGSGTNPAMIGFEQGNAGDSWKMNYTNLGLEKMGLRTKVSSGANSMSALNCEFAHQVALLDMLRIDVNTGLQSAPSPNSASCGIIMPPVSNHLMLNIGTVYISGYYTGMVFGEHTKVDSLIVIGAARGIYLQDGDHGSHIGFYQTEHVAYSIWVAGNHPLTIVHYNTEHNSSLSWGTFAEDIHKAVGSRKIAILRSTVIQSGGGYNDAAFASNDSAIYKILVGAGAN